MDGDKQIRCIENVQNHTKNVFSKWSFLLYPFEHKEAVMFKTSGIYGSVTILGLHSKYARKGSMCQMKKIEMRTRTRNELEFFCVLSNVLPTLRVEYFSSVFVGWVESALKQVKFMWDCLNYNSIYVILIFEVIEHVVAIEKLLMISLWLFERFEEGNFHRLWCLPLIIVWKDSKNTMVCRQNTSLMNRLLYFELASSFVSQYDLVGPFLRWISHWISNCAVQQK